MEAVSTSQTSVNFYETTRWNVPEDGHVRSRRRKNLKSHSDYMFTVLLLTDQKASLVTRYVTILTNLLIHQIVDMLPILIES
jgi:hypothetical protein